MKIIKGKEVHFNRRFGFVPVQLPEMDTPLNMVVVKGFSAKPMMLLTTLEIGSGEYQGTEIYPPAKHDGVVIGCLLFCSCDPGSVSKANSNGWTYP